MLGFKKKAAGEDQREAQMRMKKFEAIARKPGVNIRDLEKLLKLEDDRKNALNMKMIIARIKKDEKVAAAAKEKAEKAAAKTTVAATPATPRKPATMDPREMQARLKKFKAMAAKSTVDVKRLEKEIRAQKDPTLRREMEKELNLVKKAQARKK